MIIRQPIQCETCGQIHITRTGLGRSDRQEHLFPCRKCQLEIGFKLKLDQERGDVSVDEWIMCKPANVEPAGAPIVNLEADFLIPKDMQGVDKSFARLDQMREIVERQGQNGARLFLPPDRIIQGALGGNARGEWYDLRRTWLLTRRKQKPLAHAGVQAASKTYYPFEPLSSVADWLFRFNQSLGGQPVRSMFENAIKLVKSIEDDARFQSLFAHYASNMITERGRIYLDIYNAFFMGYDDFHQLVSRMASGLDIHEDLEVSSGQFERTKMFYGNAFEALGSLVDFLAFSNNVLQGREWSTFENLSVAAYLQLDKSSRFNAFAKVPELSALCTEADNHIRNASHHGGFELNSTTQILNYRAGKGGQGAVQSMRYTDYLQRCILIFNQILAIYCLEIVVCQRFNHDPPV